MTEVPEHLLQRSRARRAALGLGSDTADITAAATPSTSAPLERAATAAPAPSAPSAPATQVAAPPPPPPPPAPPYVEAGRRRPRIPFWVVPVLAALPLWALVYALTLDPPTPKQEGPLALGATVYTSCASCHAPGGGGTGAGPKINGGQLLEDFPKFSDQLYWVMLGTQGFKEAGIPTYGATNKPVGGFGNMPGWAESLTARELLGVVRHEREAFNGEAFDPSVYDEVQAMIDEKFPDRSAEFQAAIEEFKALPPDA